MDGAELDEIGYWSEVKLDIVRKYAGAYSRIMSRQPGMKGHLYIDGFAGAGVHISKATKEYVPGSPLNALRVEPPFSELHFIDLDGGRAASLRELSGDRPEVFVYEADCNSVLLEQVFPRAKYTDFRRALCLLDPYGLDLDWRVIQEAGRMCSIEIFLNFPVMDMNRNVLWRDRTRVKASQAARMDRFWGDSSWGTAAYSEAHGLFGPMDVKKNNRTIADAFRERLRSIAGFEYVPRPMPMRNSNGAVVYYLFFASPNRTGAKIVEDIFARYRTRGQ